MGTHRKVSSDSAALQPGGAAATAHRMSGYEGLPAQPLEPELWAVEVTGRPRGSTPPARSWGVSALPLQQSYNSKDGRGYVLK